MITIKFKTYMELAEQANIEAFETGADKTPEYQTNVETWVNEWIKHRLGSEFEVTI